MSGYPSKLIDFNLLGTANVQFPQCPMLRSTRSVISTALAPKAIGTYSQAVRAGDTVYLSGQIPLDPATMELVPGDIRAQIARVFDNLKAVAEAAEGGLSEVVKLNVYLTRSEPLPGRERGDGGVFQRALPGARGRGGRGPAARRRGRDRRGHGPRSLAWGVTSTSRPLR